MIPMKTSNIMWGLGLNEQERGRIEDAAGRKFELKNWPDSKLPSVTRLEEESPFLVWIPWRTWKKLDMKRKKVLLATSLLHTVLILNEAHELQELEEAITSGVTDVIKHPLTAEQVGTVVDRADESRNLYSDIYRMTQEIYLERELLARKNEQLAFINKFLTRASETLVPTEILEKAREDLNLLMPLRLLHAAIWRTDPETEELQAEIFVSKTIDKEIKDEWINFLMEKAATISESQISDYTVRLLDIDESQLLPPSAPAQGRVIIMPMSTGGESFGCVAMLTAKPVMLGRDQVDILHAVVKHLGLALKNALAFNEIKNQAEYDGLTRLHNRKHFDIRLIEELKRHQRYNHNMSLLLMDIDHFKRINDTLGHQAGDTVLKELGALLLNTLRTTDYAARYGGEEFIVILPQTDAVKAWALAERLRLQISRTHFGGKDNPIKVTASMGISSLRPGALKPTADLVRDADKALYTAKASGRNMVVLSGSEFEAKAMAQ